MTLSRRQALGLGALGAAAAAGAGLAVWKSVAPPSFANWAQARAAVLALLQTRPSLSGDWTTAQMLEHVAQSIEYSMLGFPALKPEWFRATVGAAAFQAFRWRGAMNHPLDQPIPGAPDLPASLALDAAVARLLRAMDAFERHTGPLQAHFAYGELDRPDYTQAHLMHLANHWTALRDAALA